MLLTRYSSLNSLSQLHGSPQEEFLWARTSSHVWKTTLEPPSILARIAAGDSDAMQACLDHYGGLVWSLSRRFFANQTEAEDAVQEVFVELWKHADRFDASRGSEPTFVATVARRRMIDCRRRSGKTPEMTPWIEEHSPRSAEQAPDWVEVSEEAAIVRREMTKLSSEQQHVLELAIEGGHSQSEIAQQLGLPLGTVKTHARRGLMCLRGLLSASKVAPEMGGAS